MQHQSIAICCAATILASVPSAEHRSLNECTGHGIAPRAAADNAGVGRGRKKKAADEIGRSFDRDN